MHPYIHIYTHTYIHAYIHTCIHTYMHTYIFILQKSKAHAVRETLLYVDESKSRSRKIYSSCRAWPLGK